MTLSSDYVDEVKALVLKSFVRCGHQDKIDKMRVLKDDILGLSLPIEELRIAFDVHAQRSQWPPLVCDIVSVLRSKVEDEVEKEIAQKWAYFLENALYPLEKIEDWAFSARKEIGEERCYSATTNDIPWIKKEFVEIVRMQINGQTKIIGDNRNWKRIGGGWALMPGSSSQEMVNLKKILNKAIGDKNESR